MKLKRTSFVAFLLCAVMLLGIGFATLTDNLFIGGEASLSTTQSQAKFDAGVYFSDACVWDGTLKEKVEDTVDSAVVGQTNPDSASFEVKSLGLANQSVMFKFTIINESLQANAIITLDEGYPTTNNGGYFDIKFTNQADGDDMEGEIVCPAATSAEEFGTVDVYVVVTLNKSPLAELTAAFNVNITATAQDKDNA